MYVTRRIEWGHPKCLKMRTGGEGYQASRVRTQLHYLFLYFCLMVSCFICRNLTSTSFKKGVLVRNNDFSPMRSIPVVMSKFFFTLNCFSEPKLVKTVLTLIKQNLRYTLDFSVTPYFETILSSVARRFIGEVILHRYLQALFYTIVIVAVTVT